MEHAQESRAVFGQPENAMPVSEVYEASSSQEAVALARHFLREGRYDWFRGQVSNEWFVVPSLFRNTDMTSSNERLDRFFVWVRSTKGLQALASDETAMYAVAQHYGIPTHFVDFTTDPVVAGFFAFDTKRMIRPGQKSAIICLDSKDLMSVALPESMPKPTCIQIHVPDLWRLIAQSGVFLVCPYSNFEQVVYPFDRIVFPYGGAGLEITREWVYPARKSQLEIALDHFFADELQRSRMEALKKRFKVLYSIPAENWSSAIREPISCLPCWTPETLYAWSIMPDEPYIARVVPNMNVDIRTLASTGCEERAEDVQALFEDTLTQIRQLPGMRTMRTTFKVVSSTSALHYGIAVRALSAALERLWDGLRVLPLGDEQLAEAIKICVAYWSLAELSSTGSIYLGHRDKAAYQVIGPHRYVEIGGTGGSTKACISCAKLVAALRPDMSELIDEPFQSLFLEDPSVIVEWAWRVEYLYDLQKLAEAIATEMAPYEVLFRPDDPIFFSPARVERIGE